MYRYRWVLWLLLISILVRPAFAVMPLHADAPHSNPATIKAQSDSVDHNSHCHMNNIEPGAPVQIQMDCCEEGTCDSADCSMPGCIALVIPVSDFQFNTLYLSPVERDNQSEPPATLHFPLFRPPIS